jgi:(p)ppGpp synthase/HD superfamily hydrolase
MTSITPPQMPLPTAVLGAYVAFAAIYNNATVADLFPDADPRVKAADLFAQLAHMRQKRKGPSGRPYIHHPRMVWYLVWQAGGTVEQQILALLHDVVEDGHKSWPAKTRTDLHADVAGWFGQDIADKLMCLSNPTTLDDPALSPAQKHDLKVAFQMQMLADNPDLRVVKLADKLANGYDTVYDRPKGWDDAKLAEQFDYAADMLATFPEAPEFFRALFAGLRRPS